MGVQIFATQSIGNAALVGFVLQGSLVDERGFTGGACDLDSAC